MKTCRNRHADSFKSLLYSLLSNDLKKTHTQTNVLMKESMAGERALTKQQGSHLINPGIPEPLH